MYLIPVEIKESEIDGKGVLALRDISAGEIVWKYDCGSDKKISEVPHFM